MRLSCTNMCVCVFVCVCVCVCVCACVLCVHCIYVLVISIPGAGSSGDVLLRTYITLFQSESGLLTQATSFEDGSLLA